MHHGEDLLVLGALFVIAYVLGVLGKRIGLPAIPIYMLVGLAASPYTSWFPLAVEQDHIALIAVVGLVLLLFSLGLEFDQDAFYANAGRMLLSGGSYIAINMAVGFGFGFALGWGSREALVIAGMTATSSSAIVTKLLIELRRLANPETPMILGVTVVEDIFIAIYLAVVGVVLSGETEPWPVVGKLALAFGFLAVMFTIARFAGRWVSMLLRGKDEELFTILFFGLAMAFAGIGDLIGVTDAIGAFVIGLVLGASRFRGRIEHITVPLRDVFGAFFFVNFGLGLDPGGFGAVLLPVLAAVAMTFVLNLIAGQLVARLNGFDLQAGLNTTVILQNRGEFALILATLSIQAGLDGRIMPFAGLYVLIMAVVGPILATQSERAGALLRRSGRRRSANDARLAQLEAALAAADEAGPGSPSEALEALEAAEAMDALGELDADAERWAADGAWLEPAPAETAGGSGVAASAPVAAMAEGKLGPDADADADALRAAQAQQQSDEPAPMPRRRVVEDEY